jgi:hypothetical protein
VAEVTKEKKSGGGKKFWRWVLGIFAVLWIIASVAHYHAFKDQIASYPANALADVINAALEIPGSESKYAITGAEGIVKLSKEEWLNLEPCNSKKTYFSQERCLQVDGVFYQSADKNYPDVREDLCPGLFFSSRCHSMLVMVGDYVLKKPEILWSMVKIAESPCSYLKKAEELSTEWGPVSDRNQMLGARKDLYCDPSFWSASKRKYSVISIGNSQGRGTLDIVIRRKDIK